MSQELGQNNLTIFVSEFSGDFTVSCSKTGNCKSELSWVVFALKEFLESRNMVKRKSPKNHHQKDLLCPLKRRML